MLENILKKFTKVEADHVIWTGEEDSHGKPFFANLLFDGSVRHCVMNQVKTISKFSEVETICGRPLCLNPEHLYVVGQPKPTYKKSFEKNIIQPIPKVKKETPVVAEEVKKETLVVTEEVKKETPVVTEEVKKETPVVTEESENVHISSESVKLPPRYTTKKACGCK